jgi:phosphatidylinositol glycan class W
LYILFIQANLPFIAWVLWVCTGGLLAFFLVDNYFVQYNNIPLIFQAVNRNQLPIFLIANLLTGAVNISIDTLSFGNPAAMLLLFVYEYVVGLLAILLHISDITLKL